MKKLIFSLIVALVGASFLQAQPVDLTYEDHSTSAPGGPRTPTLPWTIDVTDNVITMKSTPCDYTLCLYDEDGEVVYTVFVPAGTTQVILPTTLSGNFELRFETSTYYYYGYISL